MLQNQILRLGSKEMFLNQVRNIFASQTQIFLPPKETCLETISLLAEVSHGERKMRGRRETSAEIRRVSCLSRMR